MELILWAISFATRAHRHQLRKDGETPYVAHVFRVVLVLRHLFGVEDERVLTAAALHDAIEDTTTDYDDLRREFGEEVAGWVRVLSKDKRMPEEEREPAYYAELATAPPEVQLIKLADIYDNLQDVMSLDSDQQTKTRAKGRHLLDVLGEASDPRVLRARKMVEGALSSIHPDTPRPVLQTVVLVALLSIGIALPVVRPDALPEDRTQQDFTPSQFLLYSVSDFNETVRTSAIFSVTSGL